MLRKNFPRRRALRQREALTRHNGFPVSEMMLAHGAAVWTDVHRKGKQNPRVSLRQALGEGE